MAKTENSQRLAGILDSLSDISITLIADFFGEDAVGGGMPVALGLADLGVTVFPIGVVGEDAGGQRVLQVLHEHRVSTSGISKLKNYATPNSTGQEQIHGEHPVLLNLIEHARKFAAASEGVYFCDHATGAASPRLLNFIKSNGCLREKTVSARSRRRLGDFEQLTAAIANEREMEQAIGIEIGADAKKLAIAGVGMVREMGLDSFLAVSGQSVLAFRGAHKPTTLAAAESLSEAAIDLLGGFFTAALAAGAEVENAAQLAVRLCDFLSSRPPGAKRMRREELLAAVTSGTTSRVK